jgi:drug/metabolite transporter (DMT)-like permease
VDRFATLLLAAVVVFETISHIALKSAAVGAKRPTGMNYVRRLYRQPSFWVAAGSFVVGFLAWLAFLSRVPLGQGVLAGSLTIVGVMLGGRLVHQERLTPARLTAVGLITLGVALISWGRV